jgi:ribosome maturation factor RimP
MNLEALKNAIRPIVEDQGYDLYDLLWIKVRRDQVLQVVIDKSEGTIDIEDCVKVSEAVSLYLDDADPTAENYSLEVTSPGAERVLRTPQEIERFKGHYVLVKTLETEHFGTLLGLIDGTVQLNVKNKIVTIHMIDVRLIRLAIHF